MENWQIEEALKSIESNPDSYITGATAKDWLTMLASQKDIADRFVAHASAIWNKAFPDDLDGWEYGAQLERCVTDKIAELEARIAALEDEKWESEQ
ncbi:MAG: hypothetical protein ACYTBJ_14945 [Planctomycetota bacterium]|jgi:hypothetical protein